jgi:DNA helicase-2/ATP-dependent DNA helicase PcrA
MSKAVSGHAHYLTAATELRKNKEQWAAYQSRGHCVVLAGPGSGKTKVLTIKLARLIAEEVAPPRGVACLTYNTECVRELTRRLAKLGIRNNRNVFVGTVHSFCLKAVVLPYARMGGLGLPDPLRVAPPSESDKLFAEALGRIISVDERPDEWRRRCDRHRRTYLDRDSPDWRGRDPENANVIEEYERLLRRAGFIDFDDMVLLGLRLIESQPWVRRVLTARFPVLVVDEYQDLGMPLHRLVMSLCFGTGSSCRLFAVGDPDQSIYSFTGAQPELLRQLAENGRVEKVHLRLNYRSKASIVSASEVALGEKRGYEAAGGDGGVIDFHKCKDGLPHQIKYACEKLVPDALASGVARNLGEIALLYRDKRQGDVVAEGVAAAGFDFIRTDANAPYRCSPMTTWLEGCAAWCTGGWRAGEPGLSDLLAHWRTFNSTVRSDSEALVLNRRLVRFLFSHRDTDQSLGTWLTSFNELCLREAFEREPMLTDEALRLTNILGLCEPGKKLSGWSVVQFGGQGGSPNHLNLMTFHSAKGLEFDVVFMLALEQGVIPGYGETTPALKREPRRLFYVGLTRARYEVHMLYSGWRDSPYGRKADGPSEFLREVRQSVLADTDGE